MTSTLSGEGVERVRLKLDVIGLRAWELVSVLDVQFEFFLLKKTGFGP